MHPYITDSNERNYVLFFIAVFSIFVAWALHVVLTSIQFTTPWWIDAPSVIGFYGLFYTIFNMYLWKISILRTIGIVKVPNLNGVWKGHIVSSFDNHATKHDGTIKIFQRWTNISIILETKYSKGHTHVATVLTENPGGTLLTYEYLNEPAPNAEDTMNIHRGTGMLVLQPNEKILIGEYYSGRGRQNFGTLEFKRA